MPSPLIKGLHKPYQGISRLVYNTLSVNNIVNNNTLGCIDVMLVCGYDCGTGITTVCEQQRID